MITNYDKMKIDIENLYGFFNSLSIDAAFKSHLENDYLLALEFIDKFSIDASIENIPHGREALGGLHELYKWIWSVKDKAEFNKLVPHLKMLAESAVRINSAAPLISPVTGKQDDKSNKLIETIVAMYAIKIGTSVDLDDPISSSDGTNPDVMFDYQGKRIAFACKTLHSASPNTIFGNLKSAAKQINRSNCDFGYIAINAMNILPHNEVTNTIFDQYNKPLEILVSHIETLYNEVKSNSKSELVELFSSQKIRPVVLTFVHSNTRLYSEVGLVSTILKATCATDMLDAGSVENDLSLLSGVNDFIHNRL
jgi:hypothetical protein